MELSKTNILSPCYNCHCSANCNDCVFEGNTNLERMFPCEICSPDDNLVQCIKCSHSSGVKINGCK